MLLIGGEVMPYSLARIPKAGETRGNLAAGGRGVAMELTAREREIAEAPERPCEPDTKGFMPALSVWANKSRRRPACDLDATIADSMPNGIQRL